MIEWIFVGIFIGLGAAFMGLVVGFDAVVNAMITVAQNRWEEEERHKNDFRDYFHGNLRP